MNIYIKNILIYTDLYAHRHPAQAHSHASPPIHVLTYRHTPACTKQIYNLLNHTR